MDRTPGTSLEETRTVVVTTKAVEVITATQAATAKITEAKAAEVITATQAATGEVSVSAPPPHGG